MIQAIDDLLWNWARWRLSKENQVGGVPWARMMTESEVWIAKTANIPIDLLDAGRMEHYVMALDPVLRRVIAEFYLWTNPIDQKARNCACSIRTFYNRLNKAHELIEKMQRDYNVNGTEPKPWPDVPTEKA